MKTGNWQIWLFRVLVLGACALMIVAFLRPWWIGIFMGGGEITIYGWGLRHNLTDLASYIAQDVTPVWQVTLAWVYVGASIGLAIYSTWLRKLWNTLLLGIVGSGLVAYAYVAINMVVKNRLETFKISLEGFSAIDVVSLNAMLQDGHQLAYVAGGLMIVLALLRSIIAGKQIS